MTSPSLHPPMSARSFLFDDAPAGEKPPSVGHAIRELGLARSALRAVHHLSTSALGTVEREIGVVAESILALDLGDVLVSGWRKHHALTEAARRTLATPASEEVVILASHRVTSTHQPHVDLYVDQVFVNSFEFELRLTFDLTGLAAVVRAGDLVSLRGGDCLITAVLYLEGARLARRQHPVDPALVVRLHPAVPLVSRPGTRAEATYLEG